jgi:hypothetical protein
VILMAFVSLASLLFKLLFLDIPKWNRTPVEKV